MARMELDIDMFDAMAGAIREAAAALRAADTANTQRDTSIMVNFAQEAIAKGEEALDDWHEARRNRSAVNATAS